MHLIKWCPVIFLMLTSLVWSWTSSLALSATPPGFPPALKPGCLPKDSQTDLFCPGDATYACYKIPTLLRHSSGVLLALIEARKYSCDDHGYVDLRSRRSLDSGKTWSTSSLVYGNSTGETEWTTVGDANVVEDTTSGVIWMLHTRNNSQLFLSHSKDVGVSWSMPLDVSATLRHGGGAGTGHAGGIQLSSGPHTGRLLLPVYSGGPYCVYSDDHGASWHMGDVVSGPGAGEWAIAETGAFAADGTPILLGSRRNSPPSGQPFKGYRLQTLSYDGGVTWGKQWEETQLPEPISGCEGSLVWHPGQHLLFFAHPNPQYDLFRSSLTIWSSANLGASWEEHAVVWPEAAGYSSLVVMGNSSTADLGVFYDRNNHTMIVFEAQSVTFTTIAT